MEDFEKIKEITLEEAEKILPEQIAYLTMKDGEVIIVNGLDHKKFDKKEKEYEDWIEEQSKSKNTTYNFEPKLMKIMEDTEENERNRNLMNKEQNLYKNDIYNNNFKNQINIKIKNKQEQILRRKIYTFKENNYHNYEKVQNPNLISNLNNINYSLYNNIKNPKNNDNRFLLQNNYRNDEMIDIDMQRDFYDSRNIQNQNYFQYRPNPNQSYFRYKTIKPKTPLIRGGNYYIRDNFQKKGITKYIRYNNHSYVEIK